MSLQTAAVELLNSGRRLTQRRIQEICERWEIVWTSRGYLLRDEAAFDEVDDTYIHPDDAAECQHCSCTIHCGETTEVSLGRRRSVWYCGPCVNDHAAHCYSCDYLFSDCALFQADDGANYCQDCLPEQEEEPEEEHLPAYHRGYRPALTNDDLSGSLYSIELEVETPRRPALLDDLKRLAAQSSPQRRWLGWEADGSLGDGGVELLISGHRSLEAAQSALIGLLPVLRRNGCTSWDNGRCGLHLNSNTRHWSRLRKARLLYLVLKLQPELVKISGRAAHWCAWPAESNYRVFSKGLEQSTLLKYWSNGELGKYLCIRVGPDRMEWRMFRGTLKERRLRLYLATVEAFETASLSPVNVPAMRATLATLSVQFGF